MMHPIWIVTSCECGAKVSFRVEMENGIGKYSCVDGCVKTVVAR